MANILEMNVRVASLSNSLGNLQDSEKLNSTWILSVTKRVIYYKKTFPELSKRAYRPVVMGLKTGLKWFLYGIALIVYCIPGVKILCKVIHFWVSTVGNEIKGTFAWKWRQSKQKKTEKRVVLICTILITLSTIQPFSNCLVLLFLSL